MKFLTFISPITEKIDLNLVKYGFKLIFDNEAYLHVKNERRNNLTKFHLKRLLLGCIEYFIERRHNFSLLNGMNITAIGNERYKS